MTYTAPLQQVDALIADHREFLDRCYAEGTFLASGPRAPRTGGVILASGCTRQHIEALVETDPFMRAGVAAYEIVEFVPNRGPLRDALQALATRPTTAANDG